MDFSYINCLFQAINYKTQITQNVVELGREFFKIIKRQYSRNSFISRNGTLETLDVSKDFLKTCILHLTKCNMTILVHICYEERVRFECTP